MVRSIAKSILRLLPTPVITRMFAGGVRVLSERLKRGDESVLRSAMESFSSLANEAGRQLRGATARRRPLPRVVRWDGKSVLQPSIGADATPWADIRFTEPGIPGMITREEAQYYMFIGGFYGGIGEAVELGPWLGRSTYFILQGLLKNPRFSGRKLWVFDDFVWRSEWMNQYVSMEERLPDHGDFQPLFERYVGPFLDHVSVARRKITDYDGNEGLPPLKWDGRPIEALYVDCGRTFEVNEAWFRILSPYFVAERTLIVMQDWGVHAELPSRWYNQTKQFTDAKGERLQLIHELAHGTVATFLYRG